MTDADPERLDDPAGLASLDTADMMRQVAGSGAQVRRGVIAAQEGLSSLDGWDRPRAVVVTGMGGSGIAGDVLAAVCGSGCPVPVVTVRSYSLPGWVGGADLVVAVSCSGSTEETLAVAADAVRRGCRLLAVGGTPSPLAELAQQARAPFVPVRSAGQPRSTLWELSVPLVVAAVRLGITAVPASDFEAAAVRLEDVGKRCHPTVDSAANPAKELALSLAGALPMVWGASQLAGVAAYRFCCQLAENAKYPAVAGTLPEANHNQVVTFDGPFATPAEEDFFRDRVEDVPAAPTLRLLLLRDGGEHPQVERRCAVSAELAEARGVHVDELRADGASPLERFASLVGVLDYVSVYLALLYGIDPTPVRAIEELKARIAG